MNYYLAFRTGETQHLKPIRGATDGEQAKRAGYAMLAKLSRLHPVSDAAVMLAVGGQPAWTEETVPTSAHAERMAESRERSLDILDKVFLHALPDVRATFVVSDAYTPERGWVNRRRFDVFDHDYSAIRARILADDMRIISIVRITRTSP